MLQQLLHSYVQKSGKADRQGQKIQHSCSKVSELLKQTIFMQLSHLYTPKKEVCEGFAVLILNISNHINSHSISLLTEHCIEFPTILPEACLQVFSSDKTPALQVLCSRTHQKWVSLSQGLSYPFQFGQVFKVCQSKNVYPSLALSNFLLPYSLKNTPLDSNHKSPLSQISPNSRNYIFAFSNITLKNDLVPIWW